MSVVEPTQSVDHELENLETELASPEFSTIDELSVTELAEVMNRQDATVALAVQAALPQISAAAESISARLGIGGRLVYVGAGTAGRIGVLDASEMPPTFSVSAELVIGIIAGGDVAIRTSVEGAEDDQEDGSRVIRELRVGPKDAVVGLAASGRTRFVIAAVAEARARGAYTVGVACNPNSALAQAAEQAVEVLVGPEVISGSTRLKSGTAQKMVLNMFSTIAMVQLGKTYGNLMVDLHVSNDKLRHRAIRIVRAITRKEAEECRAALEETGWDVKAAIVRLELGVDVATAKARLRSAGGRLKKVLHEP